MQGFIRGAEQARYGIGYRQWFISKKKQVNSINLLSFTLFEPIHVTETL